MPATVLDCTYVSPLYEFIFIWPSATATLLTLSCFLPSNYPQGPISQPISARSSPFHQQLFSGTVVDEEYTKYLVIWSCIHGATVV
eukprot:scaffold8318_cov55-Cyclotella_meneghiniana.AAC.3